MKPAGLSEGPVIPIAAEAIETGSPDELVKALTDMVREEVLKRFQHIQELKSHAKVHEHEEIRVRLVSVVVGEEKHHGHP